MNLRKQMSLFNIGYFILFKSLAQRNIKEAMYRFNASEELVKHILEMDLISLIYASSTIEITHKPVSQDACLIQLMQNPSSPIAKLSLINQAIKLTKSELRHFS